MQHLPVPLLQAILRDIHRMDGSAQHAQSISHTDELLAEIGEDERSDIAAYIIDQIDDIYGL